MTIWNPIVDDHKNRVGKLYSSKWKFQNNPSEREFSLGAIAIKWASIIFFSFKVLWINASVPSVPLTSSKPSNRTCLFKVVI